MIVVAVFFYFVTSRSVDLIDPTHDMPRFNGNRGEDGGPLLISVCETFPTPWLWSAKIDMISVEERFGFDRMSSEENDGTKNTVDLESDVEWVLNQCLRLSLLMGRYD